MGNDVLDDVIGWQDGHIIAIDQTALPHQLSILRLTTVDQLVDAIVRLAVRGAPLLGVAGALGVALAVRQGEREGWDEARLAAEAADKAIRSGHAVGPFHGMPIALKDLVDIEGRIATGGSKVWAERRAVRTATLARKLIAAGMIIIGKTHTVEFAFGGWGTNQHMGTPRFNAAIGVAPG